MKVKIVISALLAFIFIGLQLKGQESDDMRPDNTTNSSKTIKKSIKTWRLIDDYTFADSLQVDTLLDGYQVFNPALKKNPFIIHTGNLGGPYQSTSLQYYQINQDFIFDNSLEDYFPTANNYTFYNTTVPYTNVSYWIGSPKPRSEDNIKLMFSQNINPKWNAGVSYQLMTSIGRYNWQRNDNQNFRFHTSYSGTKYSIHGAYSYNDIRHEENGGLFNDDYILNPQKYNNLEEENIPVNFLSAKNYLKNHQLFLTQSYGLGRIKINDTTKIANELPIATAFHTLNIDTKKRVYRIDDLPQYYPAGVENIFYDNIYGDSLKTADSTKYTLIKNVFQLKFNEEANSLLKFGLRAFIDNEIKYYEMPLKPIQTANNLIYQSTDSIITTTSLGGQIFKNEGRNLWWNLGGRVYFQGYRIGDTELTGNLNTLFKVKNDTAGFYVSGGLFLQSPGLQFNRYYSNHIKWSQSLKSEKTFKATGGIRVPSRRFDLSAEIRLMNEMFYWNENALPDQADGVVQAFELKLRQHFIVGNIHSANIASYQICNRPEIFPLPTFSIYSSNYFENVLFKVLRFQLGFDLRYHTSYFAPYYYPATGQFYVQNDIKTGNYPFIDAFLNFHLKRANLGVKYEHINKGNPSNDYFLLPHYPGNPGSFKILVSWNFYD